MLSLICLNLKNVDELELGNDLESLVFKKFGYKPEQDLDEDLDEGFGVFSYQ